VSRPAPANGGETFTWYMRAAEMGKWAKVIKQAKLEVN